MAADIPQHLIGDLIDLFPKFGVIRVGTPFFAEIFVKDQAHAAGKPAEAVDTVGDGRDRHTVDVFFRPQEMPHLAGNVTVQRGNTVVVFGKAQCQDRHGELFTPFGVFLCQVDKAVAVQAEFLPHRGEVFFHQPDRELVIAGRNRGMGGEDIALLDDLSSFTKGLAFVDHFTAAFQCEECRMAFVHVPDSRGDAERAHGADTADTQQDLLGNAGLEVGGIKLRGQLLVIGAVFRNGGIQQVKGDTSDLHLPDTGENFAAGKVHGDQHLAAVFIMQRDDREFGKIQIEVGGFLPAVFADLLDEVALIVDETDGIEGQAHVAGFFQMVACEDAQTAGISRDGFVQTEFKGKIGDGAVTVVGIMLIEPGVFVRHVGIEFSHHTVIEFCIFFFFRCLFQLEDRCLLKHDDRVVLNMIPQVFVQFLEKIERIRIPGPPEVVSQFIQSTDAFR